MDSSFYGTIDILPEKSPGLCKKAAEFRKKQGCRFSIFASGTSCFPEWKRWRKNVESLFEPDFITIPAAVINEKSLHPGPVLSLPGRFNFLIIPAFMDVEFGMPYFRLFDYIRSGGGVISIIPPLDCWKSPVAGLQPLDLCTVMVNGITDLSSAVLHLNERRMMGFIGINYPEAGYEDASFTHIFPNNYKLNEHGVISCLKKGNYAVSSAKDNYVKLDAPGCEDYSREIAGEGLKLELSSGGGKAAAELFGNGKVESRFKTKEKPRVKEIEINGKGYYFLKTGANNGFSSISKPVFTRHPAQLWGDHHVHSGYSEGFRFSRMDYAVHGLYGQVKENFPGSAGAAVYPGGEIHGITDRGKKGNHHLLIIQEENKPHAYCWEPGEGWENTIKKARDYGDYTILAHPALDNIDIEGMIMLDVLPEAMEVLHGFTLFSGIISSDKRLMKKFNDLFPSKRKTPEGAAGKARARPSGAAVSLWDGILSRGFRCLGVADGDIHGLAFHGLFASNRGIGRPVTIVNSAGNSRGFLEELRGGNVWFTDSGFFRMGFSVNGGEMGSTVNPSQNYSVQIECESCYPIIYAGLVSGGRIIKEINCRVRRLKRRISLPEDGILNYVRICLEDKKGNTAYSNPVYIK